MTGVSLGDGRVEWRGGSPPGRTTGVGGHWSGHRGVGASVLSSLLWEWEWDTWPVARRESAVFGSAHQRFPAGCGRKPRPSSSVFFFSFEFVGFGHMFLVEGKRANFRVWSLHYFFYIYEEHFDRWPKSKRERLQKNSHVLHALVM